MKPFAAVALMLLSSAALSQTPPPKVTPSPEGPGTEAGKEGKPGASWSEAAKQGKQAKNGSSGSATPAYNKQKAAEQKATQDGGPVVVPAATAKP
jgi:hypothetical protein